MSFHMDWMIVRSDICVEYTGRFFVLLLLLLFFWGLMALRLLQSIVYIRNIINS